MESLMATILKGQVETRWRALIVIRNGFYFPVDSTE
jgi:hypothetical protein